MPSPPSNTPLPVPPPTTTTPRTRSTNLTDDENALLNAISDDRFTLRLITPLERELGTDASATFTYTVYCTRDQQFLNRYATQVNGIRAHLDELSRQLQTKWLHNAQRYEEGLQILQSQGLEDFIGRNAQLFGGPIPISRDAASNFCPYCQHQGHFPINCSNYSCVYCNVFAPGHLPAICPDWIHRTTNPPASRQPTSIVPTAPRSYATVAALRPPMVNGTTTTNTGTSTGSLSDSEENSDRIVTVRRVRFRRMDDQTSPSPARPVVIRTPRATTVRQGNTMTSTSPINDNEDTNADREDN